MRARDRQTLLGEIGAAQALTKEQIGAIERSFPVQRVPIGLGRLMRVACWIVMPSLRGPRWAPGPDCNSRSRKEQHGTTTAWEPLEVVVASDHVLHTLLNSLLTLLAGFLVLAAMSGAALAADLQGAWLTEDKDAVLKITKCGDQLCGRIIWLESATDRSGSLRLDQNNPDPAKHTQRICGLVVISGLKPTGPDTWDGSVYNPQDGQTYSGNITVLSDQALKVRAYIGLPVFGRSQTWTRVSNSAANDIEYNCRSHG